MHSRSSLRNFQSKTKMSTSEIKSPFKFLDHYTKTDVDFFFGRNKEVRTLYEFVNKNRVVLVYGQSGTGKTSIIQCGLANEFEVIDWMPFYIRRGDNLNNAIANSVHKNTEPVPHPAISRLREVLFDDEVLSQKNTFYAESEKQYITSLIYNIQKITETYLRPVYLILDQFEEFLILAKDDEKKLLVKTLKVLLGPGSMVDCHVIIVMREEYFAWLDTFEKDIPGLSDRRLRIEPMRRTEIKSVITESCAKFNIKLLNPEKDAEQIINALSKSGSEVSLPYLQVYLDQLWRIDFHRTYPHGYSGNESPPPLEFTAEEIEKFGEIKDVLHRFLDEQKTELQKQLEVFEKDPVPFINKLLDSFVNEQGTKRPHVFEMDNGFYAFGGRAPRVLQQTDKKLLKFALDFLQNSQIIRNVGNSLELGHDMLAKLIDRQRDAKMQKLNGIPVMAQYYRQENKYIPNEIIQDWDRYRDEFQLKREDNEWYLKSKKFWEDEKKRRNIVLYSIAGVALLFFMYSIHVRTALTDNERANGIIAKPIQSKKDHLVLLKATYDAGGYDSEARLALEAAMLRTVQDAKYAEETAAAKLTIESTAELRAGLDVDISADGKYISIRNDEVSDGGLKDRFSLFDLSKNKIIANFEEVKYAYFLNDSDTLLLALTNSTSKVLADFPSYFILYNCAKNVLIDTMRTNEGKNVSNVLYNNDFLKKTSYSDRDSYKIRRLASGRLMVPCLNNSLVDNYGKNTFAIESNMDKVLVFNAPFSISTSPSSTRFMYCVENQMEYEFKMYEDKTGAISQFMSIPDSSFQKPGFGVFADFIDDNSLVFNRNDTLLVKTRNGDKKYKAPDPLTTVYSGRNSNYLLATDINDQNSYLINYAGKVTARAFKATIAGYHFAEQTVIFQEQLPTRNKGEISRLLAVKFNNGSRLRSVDIEEGMESSQFNTRTGCILVKEKKAQKSPIQLLYLYDNQLALKASFYITPNDTYAFSKNGNNFYMVRNNELLVFENKMGDDISSFETINKMLDDEKKTHTASYNARLKQLQDKYRIENE
jgi:hypothetical protein